MIEMPRRAREPTTPAVVLRRFIELSAIERAGARTAGRKAGRGGEREIAGREGKTNPGACNRIAPDKKAAVRQSFVRSFVRLLQRTMENATVEIKHADDRRPRLRHLAKATPPPPCSFAHSTGRRPSEPAGSRRSRHSAENVITDLINWTYGRRGTKWLRTSGDATRLDAARGELARGGHRPAMITMEVYQL